MITGVRDWVAVAVIMGFMVASVSAIPDPAAVYCHRLGYEYMINWTGEEEVGVCRFPDGSVVRAWGFLRGEAGQEHNYCREKGYEFRVVVNDSRCPGIYFGQCVLCVSPGGEETEVTELMKQDGRFPDFSKYTLTPCNRDGTCEPERGEDYGNCPQDCILGEKDGYCDVLKEGVCDPDCRSGEDLDCVEIPETTTTAPATMPSEKPLDYLPYIAILFTIIILGILAYRETRK